MQSFLVAATALRSAPYCRAPRQRLVKRGFDILIGATGLLLCAPLLAVVALGIKRDSPGPVLFRQEREGYRRTHFTILKFRTMSNRSHAVFEQARRNDQRVTHIGAYLRAASFDELPQLLNVLGGSLSLVGPRPHVPELSARFATQIEGYYERLAVRPGLTGLAQVSGLRGETETLEKMSARIACDREYVKTGSLLGDLAICIKTAFIPLGHDGAY
jgi:lipopolysaccharide/colanic/teichoic acid biosynthesis glycosyltransferase